MLGDRLNCTGGILDVEVLSDSRFVPYAANHLETGLSEPWTTGRHNSTHWSILFVAVPTFSNLALSTGSPPPSSDSLN